jgi:hypothetical protein
MRAVDDRAERQFLMPGRADLAHHEEIELRVEPCRHFVTDRRAAARQGQNEGVAVAEAVERAAKPPPGVTPVSEHQSCLLPAPDALTVRSMPIGVSIVRRRRTKGRFL